MSASRTPSARAAESKSPGALTTEPMQGSSEISRRAGNEGLWRLLRARVLQPRLTVSNPDDVLERDADRVADEVMRTPLASSIAHPPKIQRKCDQCDEELHRSGHGTADVPTVDATTENSIAALSGRGAGLTESVRSFMEPRFKADFSAVRVHNDAHAHELARAVNAKAFTVGHNVVFGAGQYSPETDDGKRLLAHELTHVVQQSGVSAPTIHRRVGWSGPVGKWNQGATEPAPGWRRVPLEGFAEGNQNRDLDAPRTNEEAAGKGKGPLGRAIAVFSTQLDPKSPVRIILHFHGLTFRPWDPFEGYRERATADKDHKIEAGTVRDVALDRVHEQLESAQDPQLIALLVQGTGTASFGQINADAYIKEALQLLVDGQQLAVIPPRYSVVLSAHSAGERTVGQMLDNTDRKEMVGGEKQIVGPSNLEALVLFESINSTNQRKSIERWVDRQLDALAAKLAAAIDSKARDSVVYEIPGLRGYYTTTGSYVGQYKALQKHLDKALADHAAAFGDQAAAIARRFSIEAVSFTEKDLDGKIGHERLIGGVRGEAGGKGGALADALHQLAPPVAKVAPATGGATIQRQAAAPAPAAPAPTAAERAAERAAARAREQQAQHDALVAQMESALVGMTLDQWMADMRPNAQFLGLDIHGSYGAGPGVHQQLLDRLQLAERALRARPEFDGKNDAQIRSLLKINDVGGLRSPRIATGGTQVSWHSFGLAVDINASTNPFVGNAKVDEESLKRKHREDLIPIYKENRSPRIVERAMLLRFGRKDFDIENTGNLNIGDAAHHWDMHREASDALAWYLSLDLASTELAEKVTALNNAGDTRDLAWWQERIRSDITNIPHYDFESTPHPERTGYMDLPRSLIEAMDSAGLNWGGAYPGAKDIMHFDYHSPSINRAGANARPPARPAAAARPPAGVQRMPLPHAAASSSATPAVGHNIVFAAGQFAPRSIQRSPDFGPPPPQFTPPQSVGEMARMLEDAEDMLVDPAMLDRRARLRLYGADGAPKVWKPDTEGALRRVDAALDFVKPLVQPANIKQHGKDGLTTSVMGLYYSTEWLQRAKDDYDEVSRLRGQAAAGVRDLVTKARSALGFRSPAVLKVLADEVLSFELESGSSPRPAPEFSPQLRQQFPDAARYGKRELRVLAWLSANKDAILKAERDFRVDRRAIAGAIAWEAMENIMKGSPRTAGPGKMHTYKNATASVLPVSKDPALPQQLEELGVVPKPKDDADREAIMRMPQGSITYIAAAMRAAADIAAKHGYEISHELGALTSFYQGHDLPSWEKHMAEKQRKKEMAFIAVDPMAKWTQEHVEYLEIALGSPIY